MLDTLIQWDQQLLLFFNGLNTPFLDDFFGIITEGKTWIPFYIAVTIIVFRKETLRFTRNDWRIYAAISVSLGLVVLLCDQTASGFMKPFFERFRPSHEPAIKDMVKLYVKSSGDVYRGGKYGFVSSHAANSFGIAYFVIRVMKNVRVTWAMMLWAILFSYSRIYLGVHYPGDIIGGAVVGILFGYIVSLLYFKTKKAVL